MLNPLNIPDGVALLFSAGLSSLTTIGDTTEHRPDLILPQPSMKLEILNNKLNNTSPISLLKGDAYKLSSNMFVAYFSR